MGSYNWNWPILLKEPYLTWIVSGFGNTIDQGEVQRSLGGVIARPDRIEVTHRAGNVLKGKPRGFNFAQESLDGVG